MSGHRKIVFFDSNCALCHWSVRFILRHDTHQRILFAPIYGHTWQHYSVKDPIASSGASVLFFDGEKIYEKSDAAFKIIKNLSRRWHWMAVIKIIPRSWRNMIYDFIANNRYWWFGKVEECSLASRFPKERLLD